MSRSITEIFDSMIAEKESFSSLDDLVPNPDSSQTFLSDITSASKVAFWRLIFWVIAFAIFTHEKLFDQLVIDVETAAQKAQPGVTEWYVVESLKFQFGFSLQFDTALSKFVYSDTTSPTAIDAKIVSNASAREIENGGVIVVTIKLAKTVSDLLQKLTAEEKAAFTTYLDKFKIAGTKTLVISDDPDFLKAAFTIQYDPQLIDAAGILISDGTTKPIQVAIDDYIEGLTFDATFRVQDLTDAIQLATGVINTVADVIETKFAVISYENILAVVTEDYVPNAGYLATVDETGTETVPVLGDINIISTLDYDDTGTSYAVGDFSRFKGIVFKSNAIQNAPAGAFDTNKWDTISNLTLISI